MDVGWRMCGRAGGPQYLTGMLFVLITTLDYSGAVVKLSEVPAPRFASAGTHPGPVSAVDDRFTEIELDGLRGTVLGLAEARGTTGGLVLGNRGGFEGSYSWGIYFTLEGLLVLLKQLPTLRPYFEHALDPESNCFLLNSVVTRPGVRQAPPEHAWATGIHVDDSIIKFTPQLEGYRRGLARTVTLLYLQSGAAPGETAGGELEVFAHSLRQTRDIMPKLNDPRFCQHDADCAVESSERLLKPHLAARLFPRPGRLAQFNGTLPHAVRPTLGDETPSEPGLQRLRVSLILEQFSVPSSLLPRVPTLAFSLGNGVDMQAEAWDLQKCGGDGPFRRCAVQIKPEMTTEKWAGCRSKALRAFGSRVDEAGFTGCALAVRLRGVHGSVLGCLAEHLNASQPCDGEHPMADGSSEGNGQPHRDGREDEL